MASYRTSARSSSKGGISKPRSSCHCKLKWDQVGFFSCSESEESGKDHDSNSMTKLARYAVNSFDAKQKQNNQKKSYCSHFKISASFFTSATKQASSTCDKKNSEGLLPSVF